MGTRTTIAWTDATWSPVSGCTRISPGCEHCYLARTPPFRITGRAWDGDGIGATTGVTLHPERLGVPLGWRKPRRVFVCSLADLFHDAVPDQFIAKVWATMSLAPQHTFQVLTKRPARMRSLLSSEWFWGLVSDALVDELPDYVCGFDNVWIGVSAENQEWANRRIPILLDTPAAVRWVSAEPLLGPIDLGRADRDALNDGGIDWAVAGGESGPGARPMHPDWARSLRDQCVDAKIPFHFKQHGEWIDLGQANGLDLRPGGEIRAYPGALLKRVGKKAAGRVLDGRVWDEYPVVAP